MRTRFTVLAVTVLVGIFVSLISSVYSQPAVPRDRVSTKGEIVVPKAEIMAHGHRGHIVMTLKNKNFDPKLINRVMACVRNEGRRDDREAQFDSVLKSHRLDGWHSQIIDITAKDGVTLVTLRVIPLVTPKTGGGVAMVAGGVDETYELGEGEMILQSSKPTGGRNQFPVLRF